MTYPRPARLFVRTLPDLDLKRRRLWQVTVGHGYESGTGHDRNWFKAFGTAVRWLLKMKLRQWSENL